MIAEIFILIWLLWFCWSVAHLIMNRDGTHDDWDNMRYRMLFALLGVVTWIGFSSAAIATQAIIKLIGVIYG